MGNTLLLSDKTDRCRSQAQARRAQGAVIQHNIQKLSAAETSCGSTTDLKALSELNADVEFVFLQLDSIANAAPATFKEVDDACVYIQENLDDKNLNVTMISETVGTIPQRLIPMFQKQLNMGIAEYVNYQRIERAAKLLTTTKLKVHQISDQVGYCNTDTFTRNFRKLMGATPTEYRQMSLWQ